MGLYLCVFDGEEELDGVEVGFYADFGTFRNAVVRHLENGKAGSRFPTLIHHSDSDGEWSPVESKKLERELLQIELEFSRLAAMPVDGWRKDVAERRRIELRSLADCFFDIDGEPLINRLVGLVRLSQRRSRPILFQ